MTTPLRDNNRCYACGRSNPHGLQLSFSTDGDGRTTTRFTPDERFQGWEGIVHGGIIVTLLDETMAKAAAAQGYRVLTGEVTARFRKQAATGAALRCEATVDSVKKGVLYASAAAYNPSGTLVARATSKMVIRE